MDKSYSIIAQFYDILMAHVNYYKWIRLIENVIKKYIKREKIIIFEIGGGTGILAKMLKEKGYSYFGSDLSFEMCKESMKKGVPFLCADGRALPIKKEYDLVIFLYDGINYLQTLTEYTQLFFSVYKCLRKDGFFLFDITTHTNSYKFFRDSYFSYEIDNITIIRHSYYIETKSLQVNEFCIFYPVENRNNEEMYYVKKKEVHYQKLFEADQIISAIPLSHFKISGVWDGFSMKKFKPSSERIHFLLQKK
ncbi:MAG: class I SAM-dependent methyltransferase [Chitinispirillaceae bacterium]|nr:class I SAM-dependent methyltransferase [Chitinispirillaceae bacterium]